MDAEIVLSKNGDFVTGFPFYAVLFVVSARDRTSRLNQNLLIFKIELQNHSKF